MLHSARKTFNCNIFVYYLEKFPNRKNNMIKVSESASKKIVDMMKDDGFDVEKDYVRVGVKSGGCSGLSYDLTFDKNLGENDKVFEDNNVKIAVEKKSFLYLAGTILEFSGGLNGKGFVFNNPNAQRTCGCGESFSL
jgi:iron-sulfur cluster assembly protein